MGGITGYILHKLGKKDALRMEDVRENQEEGGIYEVDVDMDVVEFNEL